MKKNIKELLMSIKCLLCCVYESFVKISLKYYNLNLSHYFSSPRLSFDAMLKMTGIKLQKIDNTDMHLFIENGMRDGISYISKKYFKSGENKTMYRDANNLYGWTLIQSLPVSDFRFLSEKEI